MARVSGLLVRNSCRLTFPPGKTSGVDKENGTAAPDRMQKLGIGRDGMSFEPGRSVQNKLVGSKVSN